MVLSNVGTRFVLELEKLLKTSRVNEYKSTLQVYK